MGDELALELPEIIELNDFGGDIDAYIEHLYELFQNDFYDEKIYFEGKQVVSVYQPADKHGRPFSFGHATSAGKVEVTRDYDLRRAERLCWIKPIIEAANSSEEIIVWKNVRRKKVKGKKKKKTIKTCLLHVKTGFLVCIQEAGQVYKFNSSYNVHNIKKYIEEYEEYLQTGLPVDKNEGL